MTTPQDVLDFWLREIGPEGWYVAADKTDAAIRDRFSDAVNDAGQGAHDAWSTTANGALALLILLDQFPRNLYRGSADAFRHDGKARDIARAAIVANLDLETAEPGRQFFYLPFEHSESLADQDWCVALFESRMTENLELSLRHAKAHRDVIARFGRFPFRNEALGRQTTAAERAYLDDGGYRPGMQP